MEGDKKLKKIVSEKIIDGVKITDYDDGSSHFEPIEIEKPKEEIGFFQKIINWFKKHEVKPYIKKRDLADPFGDRKNDPDDIDGGCDGVKATEIGIEIKF